jgi:hypothetical protein
MIHLKGGLTTHSTGAESACVSSSTCRTMLLIAARLIRALGCYLLAKVIMDRITLNHYISRLFLIPLLTFTSCGPCMQPLPQPSRPSKVEGWKDIYEKSSGVRFRAVLLLKKGESSDNGTFGVKAVDILEASPCCGDPGPNCYRRARIQFYNPADGRVLCEVEVARQENHVIDCADALGVSVIGVREINTVEGWVLFDLRG